LKSTRSKNALPRIAVVMGGASAEREISLQTGAGVLAALQRLDYPCAQIDFDETFAQQLREFAPAAVFNALHGGAGEDGTLAAILDWLGVAYQGSDVRASAVAMDKWMTKAIARARDIPVPRAVLLELGAADPIIPDPPGLPCVVKPVAEGSAVGVNVVHVAQQWPDAVMAARAFGAAAIVEEYIHGREFTVAILDDDALPVVEITPHDDFYTYHAKYTAGASTHTVPAALPEQLSRKMQEHAQRLHRALGCRDYSRIDVIMSVTNSLYVLECNTLPGLTPVSLFPEAAAAAGITYDALIERLVAAALGRARAHAVR
jgi:D-alanine-D-alanine ligase